MRCARDFPDPSHSRPGTCWDMRKREKEREKERERGDWTGGEEESEKKWLCHGLKFPLLSPFPAVDAPSNIIYFVLLLFCIVCFHCRHFASRDRMREKKERGQEGERNGREREERERNRQGTESMNAWNEWMVFQVTILHCKVLLGWGQTGLMRWILGMNHVRVSDNK